MGNRLLADRYELIQELGRGGMASVWRARDRRLDRLVAVKIAHTDRDDELLARRIEREAKVAAGINHRNVVTVYDSGTDEGEPFLVMELLDGRAMSDHMPSIEGAVALGMVAELGDGLAAIHAAGITHRDVKPGNVVVTADGPKLTDFGIARAEGSDRLTQTNQIVGTPSYAAPEVLNGSNATPKSDVYSLAVVLAELLSGVRPAAGAPALDIGDDALAEVIRSALAHDPERRPAAGEFAAALRRGALATEVMSVAPVYAVPPTATLEHDPPPMPGRSSRRWAAVFTVLGVAVIVVAGLLLGALWASGGGNASEGSSTTMTTLAGGTTSIVDTTTTTSVPVIALEPSTTTTTAPSGPSASEAADELVAWVENVHPSDLKPKDAARMSSLIGDVLREYESGDPKDLDKTLGELERLIRRVDAPTRGEGLELLDQLAAALS